MRKYIIWLLEFSLITSIGLIPILWSDKLYLLFIPIVLVVGIKFYDNYIYKYDKLENVKVLLDYVWRILEYPPENEVRLTFHKVQKGKYKQVLDYVPVGKGKNRSWSTDKGLVGKCIERKKLVIESFESDEEYRKKMIEKYNFSQNEIQEKSAERMSYLCFPVIDDVTNKVEGVLFIDSVKPKIFSQSNQKNDFIKKLSSAIKDTYLN